MTEYRLRYAAPLRPLLSALGMGPGFSGIEVAGDQLRVRMGWAFRAHLECDAIRRAELAAHPIGAVGVCTAGTVAGWSTDRRTASSASTSIPAKGRWSAAYQCACARCGSALKIRTPSWPSCGPSRPTSLGGRRLRRFRTRIGRAAEADDGLSVELVPLWQGRVSPAVPTRWRRSEFESGTKGSRPRRRRGAKWTSSAIELRESVTGMTTTLETLTVLGWLRNAGIAEERAGACTWLRATSTPMTCASTTPTPRGQERRSSCASPRTGTNQSTAPPPGTAPRRRVVRTARVISEAHDPRH